MRPSILLLFVLALGFSAHAQEINAVDTPPSPETGGEAAVQSANQQKSKMLFARAVETGGYGSLLTIITSFKGKALPAAGFRGALVLNNRISIGLEGQFFIPVREYNILVPPEPKYNLPVKLSGTAVGVFAEPILHARRLVHFTFPVAAGAGAMKYTRSWTHEEGWEYAGVIDRDYYWYVHPGVHAEMNLSAFSRVGIGVSYRWVNNLTLIDTDGGAFTGFCALFFLKMGVF